MTDENKGQTLNFPPLQLAKLFEDTKKRFKKYQEGIEFYEEDGKTIKSLTKKDREDVYNFLYDYVKYFVGFTHIYGRYCNPYAFYGFKSEEDFYYCLEELKDFKSKQYLAENPVYGYKQYELEYAFQEQQRISGEVPIEEKPRRKHLLSLKLEEEPGSIVRVLSLFNKRNYIVESMTFSPSNLPNITNMTLIVIANDNELKKIFRQLKKLLCVIIVENLNEIPNIERELILIKIKIDSISQRKELLMILEPYNGQIIDADLDSLTFQFVGDSGKICIVERILKDFNIIDVVRSGKVAFSRESSIDSNFIYENNIGRRYLFGKNKFAEDHLHFNKKDEDETFDDKYLEINAKKRESTVEDFLNKYVKLSESLVEQENI